MGDSKFERISSEEWLQKNGLEAKKIDLNTILKFLGFKHFDDFNERIGKNVCAKYSKELFQKFTNKEGQSYNIISNIQGSTARLERYQSQLQTHLNQLETRLSILTSGSYRVFGLLSSKKPIILLNLLTQDEQRKNLYYNEVKKFISEQLRRTESFNILNCFSQIFKEDLENPGDELEIEALEWVESLSAQDFQESLSESQFDAVLLQVASYKQADSFIIFSENGALSGLIPCLEKFYEKNKISFTIVTYNTSDKEHLSDLEVAAKNSGGKFKAFVINETEENTLESTKSFYGGIPEGGILDEDAFLIWSELEECKQTINEVKELHEYLQSYAKSEKENRKKSGMRETQLEKPAKSEEDARSRSDVESTSSISGVKPAPVKFPLVTADNYLSSQQWLKKYGLEAMKLDFYTYLAGHVFKHCNGIVNIKTKPKDEDDEDFKAEAGEKSVLINARYCKRFVHIVWKDGEIRHVQLTGSTYRTYFEKANQLLEKIQGRMHFLKEGSRELFGTICENQIYLLIDVSSSMEPKIDLVVRKLHQLLDEQIIDKRKFNIVCFNSKITPWRSHLVDVDLASIKAAKNWIRGVVPSGSTNTLDALKHALSDKRTEGVYLLTDGRPDQPIKAIVQMINLHPSVPIHTISFNCFDKAANDFLHRLSNDSGGRFHLYQDVPYVPENDGPRPHVSYDLTLLQQEYESVSQNLKVIRTLRQECELLEKYVEPPIVPPTPKEAKPVEKKPKTVKPDKSKQKKSLSVLSLSSAESENRKESLRKKVKGESDEWMLNGEREVFKDEKRLKEEAKEQIKKKQELKKKLKSIAAIEDGGAKPEDFESSETVAQWLEAHSLSAKRLTLIDVLQPTVVNHSAKYVPILDKHVTGKVFEEIFPDFYVSSGDKQKIKYVNPNAVDLKSYERKVEKQISVYKNKLNHVIWEGLPDEAKWKHFGQNSVPVSFFRHKGKLMEVLEEYDWPIDDRDIDPLLDEIKLGYEMIQKSNDLRNVGALEVGETQIDGKLDSEAEVEQKPKRTPKPRSPRKEKPMVDNANIVDITPMNDKGQVFASGMKNGHISHGITKSKSGTFSSKSLMQESKGLQVIARNEIDGYYYPAVVLESDSSQSALVKFANQSTSCVPTSCIIPRVGAISGPILQVGDFVLVMKPGDPLFKFKPGILLAVPMKNEPQPHFYTVVLWNRSKLEAPRKLVLKISQKRFQTTARYIEEMKEHTVEIHDRNLEDESFYVQGSGKLKRRKTPQRKLKTHKSPYEQASAPEKSQKRQKKHKKLDAMDAADSTLKATDKQDESIISKSASESAKSSQKSVSTKNSKQSKQSSESKASKSEKKDLKESPIKSATSSATLSSRKSSSSSSSASSRSGSQKRKDSPDKSTSRSVEDRSPTRFEKRGSISDKSSASGSHKSQKSKSEEEKVEIEDHHSGAESSDSEIVVVANENSFAGPSDDRPETPTPNELAFGGAQEPDEAGDLQDTPNVVLSEKSENVKDQFLSCKTEEERSKFLQELLESKNEEIETITSKTQSRVMEQIRAAEKVEGTNGERNDYIHTPGGVPITAAKLEKSEEILAKWTTDQWLYKNEVIQDLKKGYYAVSDKFHNMDILSRLEMISEENDADEIIKKDDFVISPYPFMGDERFGPGKVVNVSSANSFDVEFFDGRISTTSLENCYKISFQRFAADISGITTAINNWVGLPVVFKDALNGALKIGLIWDYDSQSKNKLIVKNAASDLSFQIIDDVYGPIRKGLPLSRGEHVLVATEKNISSYYPGVIVGVSENSVNVKVGQSQFDGISKYNCIWLNRRQFNELMKFSRDHNLLPSAASPSPQHSALSLNQQPAPAPNPPPPPADDPPESDGPNDQEEKNSSSGESDFGF